MTNQQILYKAIEKAEKNGFNIEDFLRIHPKDKKRKTLIRKQASEWFSFPDNPGILLFNHDFAKAFWDKEYILLNEEDEILEDNEEYREMTDYVPGWKRIPAWQHHLKIMVLEKGPIKYLSKFI